MKCTVQWVDANGKPTPDENDAVALAHFHKVEKLHVGPNGYTEYSPEVAGTYGVCAEHMKRVKASWHFGQGGGWTFEPLTK